MCVSHTKISYIFASICENVFSVKSFAHTLIYEESIISITGYPLSPGAPNSPDRP